MRNSVMKTASMLIGAAALFACGSDSTAPPSALVGSYNAVTFITTGGSGQTNQLVVGSTVTINLAANGTTTGHLHMAASGATPALDADMAGTWVQSGTSVTFSQPADTFIRNMTFTTLPITSNSWELVGDQTFSGTRIQLILSQVTL